MTVSCHNSPSAVCLSLSVTPLPATCIMCSFILSHRFCSMSVSSLVDVLTSSPLRNPLPASVVCRWRLFFLLPSEHKHHYGLLASFPPQAPRTLTFTARAACSSASCASSEHFNPPLPSPLLLPLLADAVPYITAGTCGGVHQITLWPTAGPEPTQAPKTC